MSKHDEILKVLDAQKPKAELVVAKQQDTKVELKIAKPLELNRDEAILHILGCCRYLKNIINWQITARVTLVSLYSLDGITDETYEFIDQAIADGVLINLEWKLDAPAAKK
jgi:hypothetical protein